MSRMITISETFILFADTVGSKSAEFLVDQCRSLGMKEQQFRDIFSLNYTIPNFDNGYIFYLETDNNLPATIEILEKDGSIMQAGIQIKYSQSIFPELLNQAVRLLDNYYGFGLPIDMRGNLFARYYTDAKTLCYITSEKFRDFDGITLRVGNPDFPW